ncbi:hypothetical protein BX600DRAFT_505371 [Xylariales sp. PMI_506]|nr:hypothetical protein BX600DRAFT_505371 [Xylariales sp. PMI_506]
MADTRGPQLQAVLISFLVFAFITIAARCYTRVFIVKIFLIEDWLTVIALVLYAAFTACALMSVHYGLGSHVDDVPLEDRAPSIMWRWIAITFYIIVSGMTKLIVGIFLTRVCTTQRWHRVTLWVLMGIISVFSVFYAVLNINSCHPISQEWDRYKTIPIGTTGCNTTLLATIPTYISAFLNVIADWILAILPAIVLWNLKMDRKLKATTYFVLAIGSIASIATIVRIPYAKTVLVNPDYLYTFTDIAIWSAIELGLALSASSLATLKPLFRKMSFFTTHSRSSKPRGATGYELSNNNSRRNRKSGREFPPSQPRDDDYRDRKFMQLDNDSEIGIRTEITVGDYRESKFMTSQGSDRGIHKEVSFTNIV